MLTLQSGVLASGKKIIGVVTNNIMHQFLGGDESVRRIFVNYDRDKRKGTRIMMDADKYAHHDDPEDESEFEPSLQFLNSHKVREDTL